LFSCKLQKQNPSSLRQNGLNALAGMFYVPRKLKDQIGTERSFRVLHTHVNCIHLISNLPGAPKKSVGGIEGKHVCGGYGVTRLCQRRPHGRALRVKLSSSFAAVPANAMYRQAREFGC
jgi:hypothetical protein